jgi:hypothetical protein
MIRCRPLARRWPQAHPVTFAAAPNVRTGTGGALTMTGLFGGSPGAGPVGPVPGSGGMSYNGMDPSDPATWVRPYNPQPGMIGRLNYDGAAPNRTQTV